MFHVPWAYIVFSTVCIESDDKPFRKDIIQFFFFRRSIFPVAICMMIFCWGLISSVQFAYACAEKKRVTSAVFCIVIDFILFIFYWLLKVRNIKITQLSESANMFRALILTLIQPYTQVCIWCLAVSTYELKNWLFPSTFSCIHGF